MTMKDKIGCNIVSLVETVSISPRHEMLTCGQINDYCHDIKGIGIMEPSDNLYKVGNAVVGRILATANENVPVRLMNPSNEEMVVYKGTVVGQFEQVKESADKVTLEVKKIFSLPEQLEELVKKAPVNLKEGQVEHVRKTLKEYHDVFALTDEQLGRTKIVKH